MSRLGWAAGFSFGIYGLRVGVRSDDERALEGVEAVLPPGVSPAPPERLDRIYSIRWGSGKGAQQRRNMLLLYGDLIRLARTQSQTALMEALEADLQLFVAERARRRVAIHAGVVGWHGAAILMPGRSFSGKSTLVAALVKAGAAYYSDEYAILDSRGRVHPYARPLALRLTASDPRAKKLLDTPPAPPILKSMPVGLILLTRYASRAKFRPQRVSAGQGLLALLENAVPAQLKPVMVMNVLTRVAEGGCFLKGRRGETDDCVTNILQRAKEIARLKGISNSDT